MGVNLQLKSEPIKSSLNIKIMNIVSGTMLVFVVGIVTRNGPELDSFLLTITQLVLPPKSQETLLHNLIISWL